MSAAMDAAHDAIREAAQSIGFIVAEDYSESSRYLYLRRVGETLAQPDVTVSVRLSDHDLPDYYGEHDFDVAIDGPRAKANGDLAACLAWIAERGSR